MPEINILLIDDNPDDRELVIRQLQKEFQEIKITIVKDKKEFNHAFENESFDLVITDYIFYWSDGLTILKKIKTMFPNMPVIMFTGTGNEEVAVEAMQAELDDYIIKSPKHFSRLAVSINKLLERYKEKKMLEIAEQDREVALKQIEKNLEHFTILADRIRNPLSIIIGIMEIFSFEKSNEIIDQIMAIVEILDQLDKGYFESKRIKEFLQKSINN